MPSGMTVLAARQDADAGKDGRRLCGWWMYEAFEKGLGRRHPGLQHERSLLYETAGVLGEEERAQLEASWREEFDRSWSPGFSFSSEGRVFTGDVARELHWIWADLPPELHEKWMAERRRRGWALRKLEEESSPVQQEIS
jgi:hypothetical protein